MSALWKEYKLPLALVFSVIGGAIAADTYPVIGLLTVLTILWIPFLYILLMLRRGQHQPVYIALAERVTIAGLGAYSVFVVIALAFLLALLSSATIEYLSTVPFSGHFNAGWDIERAKASDTEYVPGAYGILGLVWGTLYIALIAVATSWLIGLPTAAFIVGRSKRVQDFTVSFCQLIVGIPSIVWALVGLLFILPAILSLFGVTGKVALGAGITVGLMIMPLVALQAIQGFSQIKQGQMDAATALGLSPLLIFRHIVVPQSKVALWSGLVVTFSKAITETMVVFLLAGALSVVSLNPLDPMTTFTVQIVKLQAGSDLSRDMLVYKASLAFLTFMTLYVLASNLFLSYLTRNQPKTGDESSGREEDADQVTYSPGVPRFPALEPFGNWLWGFATRSAWVLMIVIPVGLLGGIAMKATPALFVAEVELSCQETTAMRAGEALGRSLGFDPATTPRSEQRAWYAALEDGRAQVHCGESVRASATIAAWWQSQSPWLIVGDRPDPDLGLQMAERELLRLQLRDWSVLTAANSSNPATAGMGQALWGTFLSIAVILCIFTPIGVGSAIFIHFYLRTWGKYGRQSALVLEQIGNALLGLPIIAYGMIGATVFIGVFGFPRSSGLVVSLTIGLISLPYIIMNTLVAIKSLDDKKQMLEGGLSLGLTKFKSIAHIVQAAGPNIIAGVVTATLIAVGETAALIPIGANAWIAEVNLDPFEAATTISGQILVWISANKPGFDNLAALGVLVLLSLVFLMTVLSQWLANRRVAKLKSHTPDKPWWRQRAEFILARKPPRD